MPVEQYVTVISDLFIALAFNEKGIIEVLTATLLRNCEDSGLLESYDVSVSVFSRRFEES